MKKMVSMLCAFMLVLSLAACGGGSYTPEMNEAEYKAACTSVSYDNLARDPDGWRGTYVKISGEVFQVIQNGNNYILMVDMDSSDPYSFESNHVYVTYTKKSSSDNFLEDDHVTIYGKAMGTQTYTTVLGAQRTIPKVYAGYIDLM